MQSQTVPAASAKEKNRGSRDVCFLKLESSRVIRPEAARRCAEVVHAGGVLRLVVSPEIIDITAKVIMTFVQGDEQAQRLEKILGEEPKE